MNIDAFLTWYHESDSSNRRDIRDYIAALIKYINECKKLDKDQKIPYSDIYSFIYNFFSVTNISDINHEPTEEQVSKFIELIGFNCTLHCLEQVIAHIYNDGYEIAKILKRSTSFLINPHINPATYREIIPTQQALNAQKFFSHEEISRDGIEIDEMIERGKIEAIISKPHI